MHVSVTAITLGHAGLWLGNHSLSSYISSADNNYLVMAAACLLASVALNLAAAKKLRTMRTTQTAR